MNLTRIGNLLFWILLIGGGLLAYIYQSDQDQKKAARQREQRLAKVHSAKPSATSYALDGGQITVLQIPYPDEFNAEYLNTQRCFVWRDASGSSTMSCQQRPNYFAE